MAVARDKITWLYFNFPPLYIKQQKNVSGFGIETMRRIWADMPEYSHSLVLATPGRMKQELSLKKNVIALGMLKTEERLKTIAYSKNPCRLASPTMVVLRKADAQKMAPAGVISIRKLFKDKRLMFADIPGINYGKLQPLIDKYQDRTRIISTPEGAPHLISMILQGRADWSIVDPLATEYFNKKAGTKGKISLVRVKELPAEFIPGYVAGPKTDWGQQTLDRIDDVMRTLVQTEELYSIQAPYIPNGLVKDFNKSYDRLIRKPTLAPSPVN